MSERTRDTASALIALAIVAGLSIGGWFLYWTLNRSGTNRQDRINRERFNFQQTYRAQIAEKIGEVKAIDVQLTNPDTDKAAVTAQRVAIVRIICTAASQLTSPLGQPDATFIAQECS